MPHSSPPVDSSQCLDDTCLPLDNVFDTFSQHSHQTVRKHVLWTQESQLSALTACEDDASIDKDNLPLTNLCVAQSGNSKIIDTESSTEFDSPSRNTWLHHITNPKPLHQLSDSDFKVSKVKVNDMDSKISSVSSPSKPIPRHGLFECKSRNDDTIIVLLDNGCNNTKRVKRLKSSSHNQAQSPMD